MYREIREDPPQIVVTLPVHGNEQSDSGAEPAPAAATSLGSPQYCYHGLAVLALKASFTYTFIAYRGRRALANILTYEPGRV